MLARLLILDDVVDDRVPELFVQDVARVLVEAAERVVPTVTALERQALGLLSPHPRDRCEAAASVARSSTSNVAGVVQSAR